MLESIIHIAEAEHFLAKPELTLAVNSVLSIGSGIIMASVAFCAAGTSSFVPTRGSKLMFVEACVPARCCTRSTGLPMSRVIMRMPSPSEPGAAEKGSDLSVKGRLNATLGEPEDASANSSGLGRKEYLLVCLATAVAGSPTLGLAGALFLPLSLVTEAPLLLAAGAGLFSAALIDLGRSALLSSEILYRGEFLGVAVYLSSFAILSALQETSVGEKTLQSRAADLEQTRDVDDETEEGSDSDEKRRSARVAAELRDWDAQLQRVDPDTRRDN